MPQRRQQQRYRRRRGRPTSRELDERYKTAFKSLWKREIKISKRYKKDMNLQVLFLEVDS